MGNDFDIIDTIEICGSCISEIGPSVGFGIEIPIKDFSTDDVTWIFEGMSDSISENWEEFEEFAEQTESECLAYYLERNTIPVTEEEIETIAKRILEKKLGIYTIEFEVDKDDFEVNYNLTSEVISEAVYECVCGNFAIATGVLYKLREK